MTSIKSEAAWPTLSLRQTFNEECKEIWKSWRSIGVSPSTNSFMRALTLLCHHESHKAGCKVFDVRCPGDAPYRAANLQMARRTAFENITLCVHGAKQSLDPKKQAQELLGMIYEYYCGQLKLFFSHPKPDIVSHTMATESIRSIFVILWIIPLMYKEWFDVDMPVPGTPEEFGYPFFYNKEAHKMED